jgi:hypothetical protein
VYFRTRLLARLLSGHVFEGATYLSETRKHWPTVSAFLKQELDADRQQDLRDVLALVEQKSPQHPALRRIVLARNLLFHYPELDPQHVAKGREELQLALGRLASFEGTTIASKKIVDSRFDFADELALNMILETAPTKPTGTSQEGWFAQVDHSALTDFLAGLLPLANALVRVGDNAVANYFASRGEFVERPDPQSGV